MKNLSEIFVVPIDGPNGLIIFINIKYSKSKLNQHYGKILNPILSATNITKKEVIRVRVLFDKNFIFR